MFLNNKGRVIILIVGIILFGLYYMGQEFLYFQDIKNETIELEKRLTLLPVVEYQPLQEITSPLLLIDLWQVAEQANLRIIKFAIDDYQIVTITLMGSQKDFITWLGIVEDLVYIQEIGGLESHNLKQDENDWSFDVALQVRWFNG